MKRRTTKSKRTLTISRRDFARGVAVAAAAAVLPETSVARSAETTSPQSARPPTLSPAAEAQVLAIFVKYGRRLSDEQRAEVRRLVVQAQKAGEAMAAFKLDNSNEPATTFRAYRPGRKSR